MPAKLIYNGKGNPARHKSAYRKRPTKDGRPYGLGRWPGNYMSKPRDRSWRYRTPIVAERRTTDGIIIWVRGNGEVTRNGYMFKHTLPQNAIKKFIDLAETLAITEIEHTLEILQEGLVSKQETFDGHTIIIRESGEVLTEDSIPIGTIPTNNIKRFAEKVDAFLLDEIPFLIQSFASAKKAA